MSSKDENKKLKEEKEKLKEKENKKLEEKEKEKLKEEKENEKLKEEKEKEKLKKEKENEKLKEEENKNENENENEDKDEITKIILSYEDYDDDEINNRIKKLNNHLDKMIDKSKSFEEQIKSLKKRNIQMIIIVSTILMIKS